MLFRLVALSMCLLVFKSSAIDIVRYNRPHSELDKRDDYPLQLITAALEATKEEFGDYEISFSPLLLKRSRALQALATGKLINVYSAPNNIEWENAISPIYFPIYRGLLGYRLLLINRSNTQLFADIKSLEELKPLRAGLGLQWSTTKILKPQGFTVVTSSSYEGLFGMLHLQRFDYFIRGINEIFYEFEERTDRYPNMQIEQTKALYIQLPVFFFVSASEPKLKRRLEAGLWKLHHSGEFDRIFNSYHSNSIIRSDIKNKRLFVIENNLLAPNPIYQNSELWVDPLSY